MAKFLVTVEATVFVDAYNERDAKEIGLEGAFEDGEWDRGETIGTPEVTIEPLTNDEFEKRIAKAKEKGEQQ
jgi:hypothetical protein